MTPHDPAPRSRDQRHREEQLAKSQRREGEGDALERQRIARDLHDSVSQLLFSATLHVRTAQHALELEKLDATGPVGKELREIGQLTGARWPRWRAHLRAPARRARRGGVGRRPHRAGGGAECPGGLVIEVDGPDARLPLGPEVEEQLYRIEVPAQR